MKILMITPYVTITSRFEFSRNKTGFGYMVYDIAKAVAKTEQVDVLCTDTRGEGFEMEGITFLPRKFSTMLSSLVGAVSVGLLLKLLNKYKMSRGSAVRLIYYWFISGYVKKVIKKGNYDVVHVHGCSFSGTFWDKISKDCGVKIVYTLHGLNSFSDTVTLEPAGKQYERDFLKDVVADKHLVSVISTGMKKTIMKCYNKTDCPNILVINNSFSFNEFFGGGKIVNIKQLYSIPESAKVLLYVGNVGVRKNQKQLIDSFPLMSKDVCNNTFVLFLGGNQGTDDVLGAIDSSVYKSHFILCGIVDKELVGQYYQQGDAVALISRSEGFGLSLIEGMHYGLPCMTFTDVDAYEDIYADGAVVGIPEHNNEAVAKGLQALLINDWDRKYIKEHSKKNTILKCLYQINF